MADSPRIAIFGAGAIGGLIGARLALAGRAQVSAVARGATLASLQQSGWRLRSGGESFSAPARSVADPHELGLQDVVIVAVKGQAMAEVAASIAPLLGPDTLVLPAMNGVPWWFADGLTELNDDADTDADADAHGRLLCLDADGRIAQAIALRRVIGCVVHMAAATPEPGLVEHRMGRSLIIGEPDGSSSERVAALGELLTHAGFEIKLSPRIRHDIWFKLWGNLTMNPVSAITGATADQILDDPLVRAFCSSVMLEASAIGECIGCSIDQQPEDRHQITRQLGAFKTSMLQDAEAGRSLELDAIVAAVRELGMRAGVATPNIDALFGLARLFAQGRGLYPAKADRVPNESSP